MALTPVDIGDKIEELYMVGISNPLRLFVKVPEALASSIAAGTPADVRVPQ